MKNSNWKTYAFWIFLSEAVGGLSGFLSRNGMKLYNTAVAQPPFSPPPFIFPIAWGILYALMGISAARISLSPISTNRSTGLNLFVAQLVVNFFWSPIFFNRQAFGVAFFWLLLLWGLVLITIFIFRKTDSLAWKLLIPYQLWLTYAAYLNAGVWYLN